jgi:uncharacterized protein YyaL (SSP411 family)
MADSLLRLHAMEGDESYRESAGSALALYAATYARAGSFAATYARALRRYLSPTAAIRVTGGGDVAGRLRNAARRLPDPFVTVYGGPGEDAAYLCYGSACSAPVSTPEALRAAYESLAGT